MRSVTHGAGESGVDVQRVLAEAGVGNNVVQVVTLGTQGVRSAGSRIEDRGKKIQDCASRTSSRRNARSYLAELVAALQNVRELRTVGSVGSGAAKFPIVVAVVAVRAKNARADRPPLGAAVKIPHGLEQAGLWQPTLTIMHDRVTRPGRRPELRQKI